MRIHHFISPWLLIAATSLVSPAVASTWPGADKRIDQACQLAEKAAAKNDPRALAYLQQAYQWTRDLSQGRERLEQAVERIGRSRGSPLLKDHAEYFRGWFIGHKGKWDDKAQSRTQLGMLQRGWIAGPFDNSSGGGHDHAFAPETTPRLDAVMTGKSQSIRWRPIEPLAAHGSVPLAALLHDNQNATAYVLALVESKRNVKAALRLGSPGRTKVFVNGTWVLNNTERRPNSFDQHSVPVRLHRGDNVILVKSSWSGHPGPVRLRLTRPQGGALSGIKFIEDPNRLQAAWPKTNGDVVKQERHAVRDVLDGLSPTKDPRLWAETTILFHREGEAIPSAAEQALLSSQEKNPSPETLLALAHIVAKRDQSKAQDFLRTALKLDSAFAPAALRLGQFAEDAGRFTEARQRYEEVVKGDPNWTEGWMALTRLEFDRLEAGVAAIERLQKAPGLKTSAAALHLLARMQLAVDDRIGARNNAQAALQIDTAYEPAIRTLITLDLDAQRIDDALKRLEDLGTARPWRKGLALDRLRIMSGRPQGRAKAKELAQLLAGRFLEHPAIPLAQAELEILNGNTAAALAFFDRALAMDNHQPEVRQRRRALSGQREELEDVYALDVDALRALPVSPVEKASGGAFVADRKVVRLYESGKSARYVDQVIRLQDARLERALRSYTVAYAPSREQVRIISAHRIEANGRRTPASRIQDRGMGGKVSGMYVDQRLKLIVFDALAPGDVVHLRYRVDSIGSNIFGGFYGDITPVQAGLPKTKVSVIAVSPKNRPLYAGLIDVPSPIKTEEGANTVLTWTLENVPPLRPEPGGPPYPEIAKMISLSTYKSWDELGRWYGPLFSQQLKLDDAARKAAREVTAGAKTNAEKIKRLYDYVVKNTRYVGIELGIHGWKPFEASETHRRRYGDCKDKSTLLTALLRDQGIDATLTLVRTRDRGVLPADHATMWAFNHAITYVPEAKLYLDPTAEFSGTTELPQQDQNAMALVVYDDGRTNMTRLPTSAYTDNTNVSNYRAKIKKDTSVELVGTERFTGQDAAMMRRRFEEPENRKRQLESNLARTLTGAKLDKLKFSDLTQLEQMVQYDYTVKIPQHGRLEGDSLVLPATLFRHQMTSAYATLPERKTDLLTRHPWMTRNTVEYELPPGAQITSLPKGETVDTKHISFKQTFKRTDNGFISDDVVMIKTYRVPTEDYAAFRQACLRIDRALDRKVELKW